MNFFTNSVKITIMIKRETLLESVLNALKDGILIFDQEGNLVFYNNKAKNLFNFKDNKELTDKSFIIQIYKTYKDVKEVFSEFKIVERSGKERYIEIFSTRLDNLDKVYILVVLKDVTEQKKLLKELEVSEKRFEDIMHRSEDPILLIDEFYRIIDSNDSAAKLFGYSSREELLKKNPHPSKLSPPVQFDGRDSYEKANEMIRIAFEKGYNRFEWLHRKKTGENFYVEVSLTPIIYHGKKMLYCVYRDLSKEKELYYLSITDPLTHIYNRRYFTERLKEEIEKIKRNKNRFFLIMFDIDHFKAVNDRYGHNVGDVVLKTLVNIVKQRIRKTDIFARWGGEEFVILLPDIPVEQAVTLAEELRKKIENSIFPIVEHITVSFGVAGYCKGDTIDTIIERVDSMLYKAKSEGRNRVCWTKECSTQK